MTEYVVNQEINRYTIDGVDHIPTGPLSGQTIAEAEVTGSDVSLSFSLWGTFTDPAIVGYKVVGEFSGTGELLWDWYYDNPDYYADDLGPPYWPEPDRSDHSFVGLNNYFPGLEWNVVGADHQVFEYSFATSDTPADVAYGGFNIVTPLEDLLVSLFHNNAGRVDFDAAYGSLRMLASEGSTLTCHRFDVVLFTPETVVKLRLYPRDDVLGFGGVARQYPPPRRGRNYGQQP